MDIFLGQHNLAIFLLDILFNTIPPCPSQTGQGGERMAVKEEEWR